MQMRADKRIIATKEKTSINVAGNSLVRT